MTGADWLKAKRLNLRPGLWLREFIIHRPDIASGLNAAGCLSSELCKEADDVASLSSLCMNERLAASRKNAIIPIFFH